MASAGRDSFAIQGVWLAKNLLMAIPGILIFIAVFFIQIRHPDKNFPSFFFPLIVLGPHVAITLWVYLQTRFFAYSLDEKFITVKQGVLNRQEKHVPYGVIQHVLIKQDLVDRIFGLATFAVENANRGKDNPDQSVKIFGMLIKDPNGNKRRQRQRMTVGFMGNCLSIPGLLKEDAEALKAAVLQKMKENPLDDNQSGL